MMREATTFVAGHRGLVGSALLRELTRRGFSRPVTRSREELDLRDKAAVDSFFGAERPTVVFLAAAKVGGIGANNQDRWEWLGWRLGRTPEEAHATWTTRGGEQERW